MSDDDNDHGTTIRINNNMQTLFFSYSN